MSGPDVPLSDLEAAAELAREGRSRLGRAQRRTARELLERFGGEDGAARERATAALELAGVVADPSLREADLDAPVTLRRQATAVVPEAVPLDRRIRVGAVGLLALALLVALALLLHHVVGGTGGQRASALPATATTPAATAPATTPSP